MPPPNTKRYPVTNLPDNYFVFTTANGLTYYGRFGNIDKFLPPLLAIYNFKVSTFEFDFSDRNPAQRGRTIQDSGIAATIIQMIIHHLDDINKALLFICDEDTDRQRGRFRQILFSAWHKSMGSGIGLRKINPVIQTETDSQTLYAGILYRTDCPDKEILIQTIVDATPQIIMSKFFGSDWE